MYDCKRHAETIYSAKRNLSALCVPCRSQEKTTLKSTVKNQAKIEIVNKGSTNRCMYIPMYKTFLNQHQRRPDAPTMDNVL